MDWQETKERCEMSYKKEFIEFMVRSGVLTFGDFTAKSGRKTPYFVNTGNYKTGLQAGLIVPGIHKIRGLAAALGGKITKGQHP